MAQGAESKKDFVHKVGIVLTEETKITTNRKSKITTHHSKLPGCALVR
jgi:hypothetical protein